MSFKPFDWLVRSENPVNPEISQCRACSFYSLRVSHYKSVVGCSYGDLTSVDRGLCRHFELNDGPDCVESAY